MSSISNLPISIRNCNPGNLRACYGMPYPTKLNEGFAVFPNITDGVQSLAMLAFDYYHLHGLHTLKGFISRYAPASENDLTMYIGQAAKWLRMDATAASVRDLRLDLAWPTMDLMRAIIHIEGGAVPPGWMSQNEWISPSLLLNGLILGGRWSVS